MNNLTTEKHYKTSEIAKMWSLDVESVRNIFAKEPGVMVILHPPKPGKRQKRTYRIPQSVVERVHRRVRVQ